MKLIKGIMLIFLVMGFLMAPSCVFAYESSATGSASFSEYGTHFSSLFDSLNPLVKGSSGGSRSSSSSSSKVKTDSDDAGVDDGNSTDDGSSSSWFWIILVIVIIAIILGIWFFFLRNR